jgi:hypothetical protein
MNRRLFSRLFALLIVGTSSLLALPVHAADEAADALIGFVALTVKQPARLC